MSIPKSHYFEARPATASRPRTVRLRLGALELELQADRGVFASKGIDPGTMILLREAPPPPLSRDLLEPAGAGRQGAAPRPPAAVASAAQARRRRLPGRAAQSGFRLAGEVAGRARVRGDAAPIEEGLPGARGEACPGR